MFENLPGLMFFYLNRQIRVEALEFISKHTVVSMISSDIKVSPRLEINVRKPPPLYCAICAASTLVEIHSIFKFPEQKGDYFGPTEELSLLRPQYLQNAEIVNITFHVSGDLNPKAITNVSGKYDDWPGPLQRLQWIFRNAPGLKVLRLIMIWSDQEHTIVDKVWVRRGSDTVDALAKMKDAFWDHVGEVKEIDVLGFTQGRVRDADVPAVVHDMSDEKD